MQQDVIDAGLHLAGIQPQAGRGVALGYVCSPLPYKATLCDPDVYKDVAAARQAIKRYLLTPDKLGEQPMAT